MDEQEVTWENQVGKDGTERLSGGLHVPCMRDVTESVESGDRMSEVPNLQELVRFWNISPGISDRKPVGK